MAYKHEAEDRSLLLSLDEVIIRKSMCNTMVFFGFSLFNGIATFWDYLMPKPSF